MLIKTKLNILSVALTATTICTVFLIDYAMGHVAELEEVQFLVDDINAQQIELRSYEKDYINELKPESKSHFTRVFAEYGTNLQALDKKIDGLGLDIDKTQTLSEHFMGFAMKFYETDALLLDIGLNEKSGLRGVLRDAVHRTEDILRNVDDYMLVSELLMLRRNEKDFLIRKDPNYAKKFITNLHIFTKNIPERMSNEIYASNALDSLKVYEKAFLTLVSAYARVGLNEHSGKRGELNTLAKKASEYLAQYKSELSKSVDDALHTFLIKIIVFYSLFGVLTILSLLWIFRGVNKGLTSLSSLFKKIDTDYDFSVRAGFASNDEIGVVGEALDEMLYNIEMAFREINAATNALAEGQFDRKIVAPFKGDLDTLKTNINHSLDNISHVMENLDTMLTSLSRGDFDVEVEVMGSGGFKTMLESALSTTTILHNIVGETNQVMTSVENGDYSKAINVDAPGDLEKLKDSINSTVSQMNRAITEISHVVNNQAQGDVTHRLDTDRYKGELNSLASAVNQSLTKMAEVITSVTEVSGEVLLSANEVAQGAMNLSDRVQEQAASLEETASTMNEMTSQLEQSSRNATETANLVHTVQEIPSVVKASCAKR